MVQVIKKRKRRILVAVVNPNEDEIHQSIDDIVKRLFKLFKYHIGKENSITSFDLFREIFDVYPDELDIFQRTYLWNVLKAILTKLRRNGELFIVNNGTNYYVLQNKEEGKEFKDRIDRTIKSLENVKIKADEWVEKQKWRKI